MFIDSLRTIKKATTELLSEITCKTDLINSVVVDAEKDDANWLLLKHCTYTAPKLYLKQMKGLTKLLENSIEELENNKETVLNLLNPK